MLRFPSNVIQRETECYEQFSNQLLLSLGSQVPMDGGLDLEQVLNGFLELI
jgi:hypothetical protein